MKSSKILLSAFIASLLFAGSAHASLTLHDSGKDKNFLYEQDSKALASSVQLVFRTGSLADPAGKEGLSDLSFESILRGTKSKARKEFFAAVEELGATITADTGSNRTIISLDSISDNLEAAIQILAEAVLEPRLDDKEISSLKNEALAQISQEMASGRAVMKRVARQVIFKGTPFAFPPNGTTAGLNAIKADDVRKFLAEQIKSGNVTIAVMSNHGQAQVKGWIEKAFAKLPDGAAPPLPKIEFQPIKGRSLYVVNRPGSATTEMGIAQRGIEAGDKNREALEVGSFLLGGDMSSRMFQELRAKKGWTYGAAATFQFLEIPRKQGGSFFLYAFPQADHTEETVLRAIELYDDYVKTGITAKELKFAKQSLGAAYPFKFATSRSRLIGRLYEFLDGARLLPVSEYRKVLNGMTPKNVLKAEQTVHDPANLAIVLVGDESKMEGLKKKIPNLTETKVVTDPQKVF
jgi:zinc protease